MWRVVLGETRLGAVGGGTVVGGTYTVGAMRG